MLQDADAPHRSRRPRSRKSWRLRCIRPPKRRLIGVCGPWRKHMALAPRRCNVFGMRMDCNRTETRTFKLSKDKQFVEKLTDVVGLYLNPPDKALVLCVDEKSQIQALDRTQPGL